MRIRIRDTGAVMLEGEFRAYQKANGGPSWDSTTDEVLEALGADPVFEGPQVSQLEFWQHSMLQGVEQVEGKWYTKYVPGPVFETLQEQNEYVAQKTLERIPSVVTARQARLALLQAGKLAAVAAAIAALPSPAKEAAQIEWEYATEIRRDWPLVQTLAPVLGMSAADLDALFIAAAAL